MRNNAAYLPESPIVYIILPKSIRNRASFAIFAHMTYNEALSYLERIKDTAIGAPVKGRFIESLFIGPTDWEQMTDFMNLRIQKGEETALTEFDSAGKSLSVYGVSVNNEFDVPHWDMIIMDNWELMIGN